MPRVQVNDFGISYFNKKQEHVVFEHLNVTFENEKFNVIMAKSGGGKTTLLRSIAGLNKYAGEIYYDDVLVNKIAPFKRNISYVSQEYALYPHLTVFENVAFPLKSMDVPFDQIKERVTDILSKLQMLDFINVKPKFLSGGQQQRVAIARAMVKRPQLIIFDEPLSNIDQELRYQLQSIIKEYAKEYHITVIYSTHNFKEACYMFDTLTVLKGDEVMQYYSYDELLKENPEILKEISDDTNI